MDERGAITQANALAGALFGYTCGELIGQPMEILVPERLRDRHAKGRAGFLAAPYTRPMGTVQDLYARRKDGSEFPIDIALGPLAAASGTLALAVVRDLTERKRAEDAVRESESKYRAVVEHIPQKICAKDRDSVYVSCNASFARAVGVRRDQCAGKTDFDFFAREQADAYRADDKRIMETGRTEELEQESLRDGQEAWVQTIKTPIRQEDGSIVGILSVFHDITKRKRAEQQIKRRSEALAVLNRTGQALSRLTPPSEIVELLYTNIGQVLDARNLYIALYDEANQSITFPVYTTNGERRASVSRPLGNGLAEYVIRSKAPLLIPRNHAAFLAEQGIESALGTPSKCFLAVPMQVGERVTGVIAIQDYEREDVYDASHMELLCTLAAQGAIALENARLFEVLRESEERYATLFRDAAEGILVADVETKRFVLANPAICHMLGYSEEEMLRLGVEDIHPAESLGLALSQFEAEARGELPIPAELTCWGKSGSIIHVDVTAGSMVLNQRRCSVGFFSDVTDRRNVRAVLRRSLEATLSTLGHITESRDSYTAGHQRRVADLAVAIARELGCSGTECETLRIAGMIHDIGKLSIPAEILAKSSALTPIEEELIQTHPQTAYEILAEVAFPGPVAEIVLEHHERLDGSGYPRALTGEQILREARILAIADVIEAMASHRPYRAALGLDVALSEIEQNAGRLYDADAVQACLRLFRERRYALPV